MNSKFTVRQFLILKKRANPVEQQTPHWITLTITFTIGLVILLCNLKPAKDRRSFGQWLILAFYKAVRFFWAIARAADVGYLEYRRVVAETPLDTENERFLGKLMRVAREEKPVTVGELEWDTAAN